MREWSLSPQDPVSLVLCADARLSEVCYPNDQIWALHFGDSEPPAVSLETTYGLRARAMRIFPRFIENETAVAAPDEFAAGPLITRYLPNSLKVRFSPFPGIDVEYDLWVPGSQAVAGRLRLTQHGSLPRRLSVEIVALLNPTDGERMAAHQVESVNVLCGSTSGLAPLLFCTGGPVHGRGPFPSLAFEVELAPGLSQTFCWYHAGQNSIPASFEHCRRLAGRNWDAELARVELVNNNTPEIYTSDPRWDAALASAQRAALSLFVGPTEHLPALSAVQNRLPDQGYSVRGDGSDYNHTWNGQSPLEMLSLADLILPGNGKLAAGLVRNFLAAQAEDGSIDHKPGLNGQRSHLLAAPALASLTWKIYRACEERAFLAEVAPGLARFVQAWLGPAHDRDGDGFPEWDHILQTGFEEHPLFSRYSAWSDRVEITTVESPALAALLYRECRSMARIGRALGDDALAEHFDAHADRLRTVSEPGWDPASNCYRLIDRDAHVCTAGVPLGARFGPGEISIETELPAPARLQVRIFSGAEATRSPVIYLHGVGPNGAHRVERFPEERLRWLSGQASLTSERVYTFIEHLVISGIGEWDRVELRSIDLQGLDHTLLLPLWAGLPDEERAARLIDSQVMDKRQFWQASGLPVFPASAAQGKPEFFWQVHPLWNAWIIEGLLAYGRRLEAAQLFTRLMAAMIQSLEYDHAFRQTYHAETGAGSGERNPLGGLAPVGLFLEILGVRFVGAASVILFGANPFPWPVTVKYHGITVLRQKERTVVVFPDGQTALVDGAEPQRLSLETAAPPAA